MSKSPTFQVALFVIFIVLYSCATSRKARELDKYEPTAAISLAAPDTVEDNLIVIDDFDQDTDNDETPDEEMHYTLMDAYWNESSGEMIGTAELNEVSIVAKSRHVAEREGGFYVDFIVTVPASMQDKNWQIRFYPMLMAGADTIKLEPIFITGSSYRTEQLRGYQLYDRYLSKIIGDNVDFFEVYTHRRQLETFLQRNIPELYALRNDSAFVDSIIVHPSIINPEQYESIFDVSGQEAIDHYTKHTKIAINNRKIANKEKMYEKYIKDPIISEGLKLDSVITDFNNDKIYHYSQKIELTRNVREMDLIVSGEIYKYGQKIYNMPDTDPLTHYITSLTYFTDTTTKYTFIVINRNLISSTRAKIEFEAGKSVLRTDYMSNAKELSNICDIINETFSNLDFVVDSISIIGSSSPEGRYPLNERLTKQRTASFMQYIKSYTDSIAPDIESVFDENTGIATYKHRKELPYKLEYIAENWDRLVKIVTSDSVLNWDEKNQIIRTFDIEQPDRREAALKAQKKNYTYLLTEIFPQLRYVELVFHQHRKGMLKDTIHSNVVDTLYMKAVENLQNYRYKEALDVLNDYNDFNTAIALLCFKYNQRAIEILENYQNTAAGNYLLSVGYVREGDEEKAVRHLRKAIELDDILKFRAGLEPELNQLVRKYHLD